MTPREALTAVTNHLGDRAQVAAALTVLDRLVSKDEAEAHSISRKSMLEAKVIGRPDSRTPVNADSRYRGNNGT